MYDPTGRVLAVLELLQSRSSIGGPELARRLETDVRSIRRYIRKLQDVDIPIDSSPGRYGGYRIRRGYRMPPLIFSQDEAVAVLLGLVGSPWLRLSLPREAVESTVSKINRVLPEATWERVESLSSISVMPDPGGPAVSSATLLGLSRAVADRTCVELDYRSAETTRRVVEPYGVAGFQGKWYLVGFCRLRRALRMFRLDRIRSFEARPERFARPEGFSADKYIEESLEAQPFRVHLRFEATREDVRRVFGTIGEITPAGEGCDYSGPVSDYDFVARSLLVSGLSFRVLGPPELKQAFARIAESARKWAE